MLQQPRIVSRDLTAARRFYSATAKPLGLAIIEAREDGFTVGRVNDAEHPVLKVKAVDAVARAQHEQPETQPAHLAFEAPDDVSVRAFYRAALEAGGKQVGYPGPQPTAGFSYYAAKVADPDGNCIECGWRH